ncbi:hypothetical protein HDE_05649 [Halotydeus destructor]|nr:hypothetical protein HDE_05649 [Halotydeus destructor]
MAALVAILAIYLATLCPVDMTDRNRVSSSPLQSESDSYEPISQSLMVKLSGMSKAEDFLNTLGIDDITDLEGYDRSRIGPARQVISDQAGCEPEVQTVALPEPKDIMDGSIVFPKCVKVPRCGGCCGPSHLIECIPVKVNEREIRRIIVSLKRKHGRQSRTIETLFVSEHEECQCQCKIQPRDCDTRTQIYLKDECKCACLDIRAELECSKQSPLKLWNSTSCSCQCAKSKVCSTGFEFNQDSCRCDSIEEDAYEESWTQG